jgi:methylated-DNA-[protein]-cysteine S-methyltransferase
MFYRDVETPFGTLCLTEIDGAITSVTWRARGRQDQSAVLDQAASELEAYVAGELTAFSVSMRVDGSDFQRAVCDAMRAIPYGETCTYGDIAKRLGVTAQAVGQACGANPIPVLIPCHRVMGANGRLVGFSGAGGVETKVALLRHEHAGGFLL